MKIPLDQTARTVRSLPDDTISGKVDCQYPATPTWTA